MRHRVILISVILLALFILSMLFNPMVYAYIPHLPIGIIILDKERSLLESDCIGWIIPASRYSGLLIAGGNVLCVDNKGRFVYEYIRFNLTQPGPGTWIYENVFYLYLSVSGHRRVEIVVEKTTSKHVVIFTFRKGDRDEFKLNTTRLERYILIVSPGESIYKVSITIHGYTEGKETLRLGAYISIT